MNTKYLLNVSIGPVQEFIQEARKIKDLWIGSYLLSAVTFKALEPFINEKDCEIIYPYIEESPLYKKAIKNDSVTDEELQTASLPNHFLVIVPVDKLNDLIDSSKKKYKNYWLEISKKVHNKIKNKLNSIYRGWDSLWDNQIQDLWQYMWVAVPISDEEIEHDYQKKAGEVQRALEERKLTRIFDQWTGSSADKCTQCGHREVMGPEELNKISPFWKSFRGKFKTNIREKDRLCAVCTAKRFIRLPMILECLDIQDRIRDVAFESTMDIASIDFKRYLINRKKDFNSDELIDSTKKLKKIVSPKTKEIESIEEIDGEFLYKDALDPEKILKEYFPEINKGTHEYEEKKKEIKEQTDRIIKILKEITEKPNAIQPSDYYAIVFMDGDDMGKWMTGTFPDSTKKPLTRERHSQLSRTLGEFGMKVPEIVKDYYAVPVYSGGDDLLILTPLRYIFDITTKLRKAYSLYGIDKSATCSAGIVIIHYSDSFKRALIEGKAAVERAKNIFEKKDAFSFTLMLYSGTVITSGYKWYIQLNGRRISIIQDFLMQLIQWQSSDKLSPGFIYDALGCFDYFYEKNKNRFTFNSSMFKTEAKRLFKRHWDEKDPPQELGDFIDYLSVIAKGEGLKYSESKSADENIKGLLKVSSFIARELSK